MSIATEIARLQTARNTIRAKMVELGRSQSTDGLSDLAAAVNGIENRGAVSATVQEGDTYTIPKGYHNGSGTVSGVAGGGNYSLQSKSVIPTKLELNVTPDSGYYGISDVTVASIPAAYQDVSAVTAVAGDVLTSKIIVGSDGQVVTGTMVNNGAVDKTLTASDTPDNNGNVFYAIPKGYHNGLGTVKIVPETKTVTPTTATQKINPTEGKILSQVTVDPIPSDYIVTTDADAEAANILVDKTAYVNGAKVTGTMPNNGSVAATIDGLTTLSVTVAAGYTSGGTIGLTSDIEEALAAI